MKRLLGWTAVSTVGASLMTLPAEHYRIDRVRCEAWPSAVANAPLWLAFVIGVALLAIAWWRIADDESLKRIDWKRLLLVGLLPHLAALRAPPFLSEDPLAYCAFGHAIAAHAAGSHQPLDAILPKDDAFLLHVQPSWRHSASSYGAGYNAIAAWIARVGGDDLTLQLRLHQLLAFVAIVVVAWLVARASEAPARAVALVLFCPLAVVEATLSAHNDALLAVTVAAAILAIRRGLTAWAVAALALGLVVKDSASLLIAFFVTRSACACLRTSPTMSSHLRAAVVGVVAIVAWFVLAPSPSPATAHLVGFNPAEPPLCVRSVECVPRALLYWVMHAPFAAWIVGVLARVAGAAWLGYCGWRASREGTVLAWGVRFLFIYYLYLHAFSQSWYLLSVLPLLPYAPPDSVRPLRIFIVGLVAYYAMDIPLACAPPTAVARWAAVHVVEGAIVIIPATIALLRNWCAK